VSVIQTFPLPLLGQTETWTRKWNGRDRMCCFHKTYSAETTIRHIRQLNPLAFRIRATMRIDGKPSFWSTGGAKTSLIQPLPQRAGDRNAHALGNWRDLAC